MPKKGLYEIVEETDRCYTYDLGIALMLPKLCGEPRDDTYHPDILLGFSQHPTDSEAEPFLTGFVVAFAYAVEVRNAAQMLLKTLEVAFVELYSVEQTIDLIKADYKPYSKKAAAALIASPT